MERASFKEILIPKIKEIKDLFKQNEWCFRFSEATVRAEIIDPLLKMLGWELPFVKREIRKMDYLLSTDKRFMDTSKKIVIESKKYSEVLRSSGKHQHNNKEECNEQQVIRYCQQESCYGLLTNGIVWCLYKKELIHEIDLNGSSTEDEICDFFYNLLFCNFTPENISHKEAITELPPTTIVIDGTSYNGHKRGEQHCDALYKVVDKARKEQKGIMDFDPSPFYRSIKRKKRRTGKDKMSGDYNIYEKIALLHELNSSLDLGFTITSE